MVLGFGWQKEKYRMPEHRSNCWIRDGSSNPPSAISSLWWRLEPHAPKENACNGQLKDLHIAGFFSSALPPPVAINYWLAFTLTCKSDKT